MSVQDSAAPRPMTALGGEFSLSEILRTMCRKRLMIFLIVASINGLALFLLLQFDPEYEAHSQVLINSSEENVANMNEVVQRAPLSAFTVLSEIQVLQSRRLAGRVVDSLNLMDNPEFNPTLEPGLFGEIAIFFDGLAGRPEKPWKVPMVEPGLPTLTTLDADTEAALENPDAAPQPAPVEMTRKDEGGGLFGFIADLFYSIALPSEPLTEKAVRDMVISEFLDQSNILTTGKTYVIDILYYSVDRRLAAKIANTIAEKYLTAQLDQKLEATQRANVWLSDQIERLRTDVEAAERAVEEYRSKAGLLKGGFNTLASNEVADLNTKYIEARAKSAELEASVRQITSQMNTPGGIATIPEVLNNTLIQQLRQQESLVIRKRAELSEELGPRHPTLIRANEEIEKLRTQINSEVQKVVQSLRAQAQRAKERERQFKAELDRVKARVGRLNQSEVQLRALEREAEASRNLFESFLQRSRETSTQASLQEPDAVILSDAPVPLEPTYPPVFLIMGFVIVASLALGVGTAFLTEMFDKRFRSVEQIEGRVRVSPLGLSPAIKKGKAADEVVNDPLSPFSESIRRLNSAIQVSTSEGNAPKVIAITSLVPGEGKTSVSVSLSRLVARSGQKVLLIDFDGRRPSVHTAMGQKLTPGVSDILLGAAKIEDVMRKDERSGADVITAGRQVQDPAQLLGVGRLAEFINEMRDKYDLIIIDTPPLGAVADALILSRRADTTVLVSQWNKVMQDEVVWGVRQLRDAGATLAGILVTQVNLKRQAGYGYQDPTVGYRSGSYYRYYADQKRPRDKEA